MASHARNETDSVSWDTARTIFTQIPDWILFADVSDAALRTWLTIASYADKAKTAFPSAATIAKRQNKGRRVIFRHLDELEAAGMLSRTARYRDGDGGQTSTHYTLAWDRPLCHKRHSPSSVENDTPLHDTNDTPPHVGNDMPRTKTKKELNPLPPRSERTNSRRTSRGAAAPRTPRSETPRQNGTNPRAIRQAQNQHTTMIRWAHNLHLPTISLEEFTEMVNLELANDKITAEQAETAIAEAARLRATTGVLSE